MVFICPALRRQFLNSLWQVFKALSVKNACCATNSTSQDIQECYRCAFYIQLHITSPDFGVLKITPLKTILGV